MNFADIVKERHAVKSFNEKKISEEQLNELLEMIRLAPTSFNLQPWKVEVITDANKKAALQEASWNQPQVGSCSHLLVFYANTDLEGLSDKLEAAMLESGVPEDKVKMFLGMTRGFIGKLQGDVRVGWAQRQAYIALANGMNGAKALGFDSCPMEGFDPSKVSEILSPPKNLIPSVMLPIGYTDDSPRPKLRYPADDLFF